MGDHYPWNDADTAPLRAARAALLADLEAALSLIGSPPAVPAVPPPSRFVKKGFYMCCVECGMEARYCRCGAQPPPPPTQGDGDASDLNRRVRECKGR